MTLLAPVRPRWGRTAPCSILALALCAVVLASCADKPAGAPPEWSSEVLGVAARIPIQDQGRVKPLSTYAGYTLLGIHHKRSVKDPWDRKLSPTAWLLDALFRPDVARKTAVFTVEDAAVLDAVGLSHEGKKKRDRYTYEQMAPGIGRLADLAAAYGEIEAKDRDRVQGGVVDLYRSVRQLERLMHAFDFVRTEIPLGQSERLRALFPGKTSVTAWDVSSRWEEVEDLAGVSTPTGDVHGRAPAPARESDAAASELLSRAISIVRSAATLAIVPPAGPPDEAPEWGTPYDLVLTRARGVPVSPDHEALREAIVGLPAASTSSETLLSAIGTVRDLSSRLANERDEYEKIPLEVALAEFDPFYLALWFYIAAFLLLAVTWLQPPPGLHRVLSGLAWASLLAAVGIHVAGIVIRCILRERPPISTLYETVLFISAAGAIVCIVAELLTRRGIAVALAPVVGALLLFIGNRFETLQGEDTMPQLVAVLDTNFWLALHVTAITLGYTGGLLAALLGHVYVLGRVFGIGKGAPDVYRGLSRIMYGILCFALIFSVCGTILGGIWANDSWGRFWGWDPKENGALLICLAQVAIIHSRLGGFLKPFGLSMAMIVQGAVVVFSWWHVNYMGVGLHSYGFTAGIIRNLTIFYFVEGAILTAGFVTWLSGRASPKIGPPAPAA